MMMQVKTALQTLMGGIHTSVISACTEYYKQYRRHVYATPKSYLLFLEGYCNIYKEKVKEIQRLASSINLGLQKMSDAKIDVSRMKVCIKQLQLGTMYDILRRKGCLSDVIGP